MRGTTGSVCPQPEPNATELPSCAHISARAAQKRRRRRWWRGEEGACRPGATSCGTFYTAPFTCSSFMSYLRLGVGKGSHPGRRAPQDTLFCPPERLHSPRSLRARPSRADCHCHWVYRTNKRLRKFKERAATKKQLMKEPWGAWRWEAVGVRPRVRTLHGVRLASGSPRAAAYLFCPLKSCNRRVIYVLSLHVSTATATGPAAPTKAHI